MKHGQDVKKRIGTVIKPDNRITANNSRLRSIAVWSVFVVSSIFQVFIMFDKFVLWLGNCRNLRKRYQTIRL